VQATQIELQLERTRALGHYCERMPSNQTSTSVALEGTAALAQKINGQHLPRYVAIEGPIGVGKTTLARKIAQVFDYPLLLEPAAENPFLDRYYRDGKRHALSTQLFFLLHRAQQVAELHNNDLLGPLVVADFLMEKDDLFARMTLDENEYALYTQIHESLGIQAPTPDLVIYLQAPVDILQERIRDRGIDYERQIEGAYLNSLADAYTEFFHFYTQAPLLVVNAATIDFANNDAHFNALLDQMLAMDGLRQYFNPNPTLL
jgi:deoxyadenosine/deoxycytidine kinase